MEQARLLPNPNETGDDQAFSISKRELSELFESDNIRSKASLQILKEWGGYRGLQKLLKTSREKGIKMNAKDKVERQNKYEINYRQPSHDSPHQNDSSLRLLCLIAVALIILGLTTGQMGWLPAICILLTIVMSSIMVPSRNPTSPPRINKQVTVLRDGQSSRIDVQELLVGDVVEVETGDIVVADGVIFQADDMLHVDESSLTGSCSLARKGVIGEGEEDNGKDPFLVSGSKVMEGNCKMIVMAVGSNNQQSINQTRIRSEPELSLLQNKLGTISWLIGKVGLISATFTLILLLLHFSNKLVRGSSIFCKQSLSTLTYYTGIVISIIIITIITKVLITVVVLISITSSIKRMLYDNCLVRSLRACQVLGSVNNICTDKTGTLTKNSMVVVKVWSEMKEIERFEGAPIKGLSDKTKELICIGSCINSHASPKMTYSGRFEYIGNKVECGLIEMAYCCGYDYAKLRGDMSTVNLLQTQMKGSIPFSSSRKRMSTVYQRPDKSLAMFSKGSTEQLIQLCTHYVAEGGEIKPIDEQFLSIIQDKANKFGSQSLRTVLLCYKNIEMLEQNLENLENKFTVLGVVGLKDPLKPEIMDAVRQLKQSGITVRMTTGDNLATAVSVAKEAEILPKNYVSLGEGGQKGQYMAMEGSTFRELCGGLKYAQNHNDLRVGNIDMLAKIIRQLRVLARSNPQDKLLLTVGLKQLDNVVAVTGEGTGDALALKESDVGFSMGMSGTEIAKESSGIVLLDDNFRSIVSAVKYGRNILQCTRKFLQYQLTVFLVTVFMVFLGALLIKKSPLTSMQMLWVCAINVMGALVFANGVPQRDVLLSRPHNRKDPIITPEMWRFVSIHSIFQIAILTLMLFKGDHLFSLPKEQTSHFTIFFNVFVFMQIFNLLNARKLNSKQTNVFENLSSNRQLLLTITGISVLQIFIVHCAGWVFDLSPLSAMEHFACILIGSLELLVGFVFKTIIPEKLYNNLQIFRINNQQPEDVDSYINKLIEENESNMQQLVEN